MCGSVVGEIKCCLNNTFCGYRQAQHVKVKLEVVCMIPFVFVKLYAFHIMCHLFNYWLQCNACKGMGWFTDKNYWNIYVREIVLKTEVSSFLVHNFLCFHELYLCIRLLIRFSHNIFGVFFSFTVRFFGLSLILTYILVCRVSLVVDGILFA